MKLFFFARFPALDGQQIAVAAALCEQVPAAQAEPAFDTVRDARLYWIHSRWIDESAFETAASYRAASAS